MTDPVPAGDARTSQLRCGTCGLVYPRAAIAREMTLATGSACRRCGGRLEAFEDRLRRNPIVAVRSPVGGPARVPFT